MSRHQRVAETCHRLDQDRAVATVGIAREEHAGGASAHHPLHDETDGERLPGAGVGEHAVAPSGRDATFRRLQRSGRRVDVEDGREQTGEGAVLLVLSERRGANGDSAAAGEELSAGGDEAIAQLARPLARHRRPGGDREAVGHRRAGADQTTEPCSLAAEACIAVFDRGERDQRIQRGHEVAIFLPRVSGDRSGPPDRIAM